LNLTRDKKETTPAQQIVVETLKEKDKGRRTQTDVRSTDPTLFAMVDVSRMSTSPVLNFVVQQKY
jgi:hypothetical protein